MLKRKVNWALTTLVVCAGLWCCLSPRTTDAAGGGKSVQISLVGADGKPFSGGHVEFLRPGGKPYEAISVTKDTWLLKNADDKLTVSVRNGREGGLVELTLPANAADLVSYVVTVSGAELRAQAVQGVEAPVAPVAKPQINEAQLRKSTRSTFNDANRPAGPHKGPSAAVSTVPVKNMALLVPPTNDACGSAIPVSVPSVTSGTTVEATADGTAFCGTSNTAPGVWYSFTGTGTVVTASTCTGTTYDSKLTVFAGSCATPVCVGGNDDTSGCGSGAQSRVTFCATAGVNYLVLVHGFGTPGATGAFDLTLASGASCSPPGNDLCVNAAPMGSVPATATVDNTFATNDTLLNCFPSDPHNKTTWYTIVGDGTTYSASTCNAGTAVADTEIIVYCGDCAEPVCVAGDDDSCTPSPGAGDFKSIATWCTEPGATYIIAVGNFSSTLAGVIQLDVTSNGVPACSGAVGCLVVTGACCNAGTCTGTTEETDCTNAGGTWFIGESCPAFSCPGTCVGDTCASAAPISSLPFNGVGNTCDCTNDYDSVCPFTGSLSQDAVYAYTPSSDQCVSVTLCDGNTDYDTKVYVLAGSCAGSAIACNDDSCSSPLFADYVSSLSSVSLTGGTTYYFVVDGYGGACGNFVLDIANVACPAPCGICPPGGVQENELNCGLPEDTVNGGCNSIPEVFSPIACGQTVCGTTVWDGATRDTDWYQVTFATDTEFVWAVNGEFDGVIGMVETSPLGNPDCLTATALDPFAVFTNCGGASVTRCVPPGTYWFFVAPDFNGPTFACGADYTASLSCVNCTPPTCSGDTCATAEVIPSTPFSGAGDTCLCNDEYDEICPFDASGSPEKVYSYTPAVDECVDISMCAGSAYDTKVYVYQGTCGTYQSGTAIACNDDECTSPNFGSPYVSEITGLNLTGGQTYYIVVDGYLGDCGDYTIDIGPCAPPCDITCAPGTTPEAELNCGLPEDTVNGGCNSAVPVFSPLTCNQSYCGTAAFDGATRDTDWYQVTVGSSTRFTWTATSEFASLTGPVPTIPAGTGNCADVAGVIDPALFGVECTPGSVVTECLPAGTYFFFMAPTFDDNVECGKQYEVGLSCEPCVIPLGACCRPDGSCEDGIAEAACQNWQGDGTLCSGVTCPQPPPNDLCDDAVVVGIPSTTIGDTSLANADSGFPTCGTAGVPSAPGVWYSVLGNGNELTASLCNPGTGYDTKLTVYCPNCAAPACVAGDDDFCGFPPGQSQVSWCSAPGETYLILVHGFGSGAGAFELSIANGAACSNPASCEVQPICGGGGDCCFAGVGPGCNDVDCCETVCAIDPFCCEVEWDINCAGPNGFVPGGSALEACGNLCGGGGATGACCAGAGCTIITADECATAGGTYLGDNSSCNGADIPGNSYTDNPGVAIPDGPAGTVSDTLNVPDSFTIADLNVDLGIVHTWTGDLVVVIEHNGTSVTIVDQPGVPALGSFGCDQDNYNAVVIDDEGGGGAIEDACSPDLTSPPNYVPNNPLSAFDGMNAQGIWTITVSDSAEFDTGSFEQWSLHFGTPGPSACIPSGACCLSPTQCVVTEPSACNGTYLGDGTNCSAVGPVTVYAADPALAIPDNGTPANPASHTINVPDSYTVADVDIDLDITHTWQGDLIVEIEHNSVVVVIVDRPGFTGTGFGCDQDNYNGAVIDDQGTGGTIEGSCAPNLTSPPNYTPNNPLSVFNGMNSAGAWTIRVSDNADFDTGTFDHWSLHLSQPGEGPCAGIAVCGNGTVEAGEECDDGNASNTDACLSDCTNAGCGDGFVQAGVEECDDGNLSNTDACTNACENAGCGDGFIQPGEQCDDGNANNTDACTNACANARCGDGIVRGGFEQCDDGNLIDNDGCTNACTSPICGDGIVQAGEECDGASADACDGVCLDDCTCEPSAIPTMSEWGLAVMALLLLIGAKLYFGRREVTA